MSLFLFQEIFISKGDLVMGNTNDYKIGVDYVVDGILVEKDFDSETSNKDRLMEYGERIPDAKQGGEQ